MAGSRDARGFTLVEVLVTMAIFALIGIASFTVLDQMSKTKTQSEEAREQLQSMQFSWLMIEQDLRQAVGKPTRPNGTDVVRRYVSSDERLAESDSGLLALVKSGYDNPGLLLPRAELQPVIYRVREGVLERISYAYVNDRSDEPAVQPLMTGVEEFNVRFFRAQQSAGDRLQNQGINSGWQGSWDTEGDMPLAIEITVVSKAYGEIRRQFLTGTPSAVSSNDREGGENANQNEE